MATKRKQKGKATIQPFFGETVYIFSEGPFPNLENTFEGSLITTKSFSGVSVGDRVIDMFTHLLMIQGVHFNEISIILKPSPQALTMAALSAPVGCFMSRINTTQDIEDLKVVYNALAHLGVLVEDCDHLSRSNIQAFAPIVAILTNSPDSASKLGADSAKLLSQFKTNALLVKALMWERFEDQFKLNK